MSVCGAQGRDGSEALLHFFTATSKVLEVIEAYLP